MAANSAAVSLSLAGSSRSGLCGIVVMAGDLGILAIIFTISVFTRLLYGGNFEIWEYARISGVLLLFPAVYSLYGLYPAVAFSPVREIRQLTSATTLVFIILAALTFLFKQGPAYSRIVFLSAWAISLLLVPLTRALLRAMFANRSWWGYPVVVFAAAQECDGVVKELRRHPELGLKPVVVFSGHPFRAAAQQVPPANSVSCPKVQGITKALLFASELQDARLARVMDACTETFSSVYVFPGSLGLSSLDIEPREISNQLALEVRRSLLSPGAQLAKTTLDQTISVVLGGALLPLMILIAALIRLESRGPALFAHRRVGRRGEEFRIWKFRTMYFNGDDMLEQHFKTKPADHEEWLRNRKIRRDPRITRIGRILRKTSLDELPQLWNVLRGDMSLVGPRPIVQQEAAHYGEFFDLYCRVKPGLTGLWQVSGRSETDYEQRVNLDVYYVRNWSPWFDIYLLFRTFRAVIKAEGAF